MPATLRPYRVFVLSVIVAVVMGVPSASAAGRPAGTPRLVDAATGKSLALRTGTVIDLSTIAGEYDVKLTGVPKSVSSVRFCLDGRCRVENRAPYTLDDTSDDRPLALRRGAHRLAATAYRRPGGRGAPLGVTRVRFYTTRSASATDAAPGPAASPAPASTAVPAPSAATVASQPAGGGQSLSPPTGSGAAAGLTLLTDGWAHDSSCAAFLRIWAQCHEAAPDRIQVASYAGRTATVMRVADGDVAPLTPTNNPRAQLNSRNLFFEVDLTQVTWGTAFGSDYPLTPPWSVFFQFHGSPYNGSPRLSFGVGGGRILMARDDLYDYDRPWRGPTVVPGRWYDFGLTVKWSKDPQVGWVELSVDGVPQVFSNGSTRLPMATIKSDQAGVEAIVANYRARGAAPWATTATSTVRVARL